MKQTSPLTDTFNRAHTYLRISVIDTCNFACTYCFTGQKPHKQAQSHLMQAAEIEKLAETFVSLGVNKIRLTGGEPLLRKDIADILRRLTKLDSTLTLSTNGYLLDTHLENLKAANITSVNVSLDTFREDRFFEIAHYHGGKRVMDNIMMLIKEGIEVKLNVVLMRGVNDDELQDFITFTKEYPVHIRFIEFMPFSANSWEVNKVMRSEELLSKILRDHDVIKLVDDVHDTAKKYKVPGYAGDFGMISTVSEPFCSGCNRLRLTAEGKMRNCLFAQTDTDLLTPLRNGEDIIPLIQANVQAKYFQYGGQQMSSEIKNSNMILIGG
jgi:cyclic pyranopterin phosphate synthase